MTMAALLSIKQRSQELLKALAKRRLFQEKRMIQCSGRASPVQNQASIGMTMNSNNRCRSRFNQCLTSTRRSMRLNWSSRNSSNSKRLKTSTGMRAIVRYGSLRTQCHPRLWTSNSQHSVMRSRILLRLMVWCSTANRAGFQKAWRQALRRKTATPWTSKWSGIMSTTSRDKWTRETLAWNQASSMVKLQPRSSRT